MKTLSKRLLSMVLALSMVLTFLPVSAFAADETTFTTTVDGEGAYTYTLRDDGTAVLTKFTGTNANVPEFVEGHTVTEIAPYAFATLKAGSTTQATPNTLLLSVTLPDSITTIGDHAFADCESLTSIALPDGVTAIQQGTFEYCTSLSSIALPAQLTSIGEGAFSFCTALSSIVLPENLTTVGLNAFFAAGLTNVTIPVSLKTVEVGAFYSYPAIDTVTYTGTLDQWEALVKADDFALYNDQLVEAPHFSCAAYSMTPAPSKPDTPSTPETPSTPSIPSTPDTPDTPSTPDTPGTPDNPDTPNDPELPEVEEDDSAAGFAAAATTAALLGWGAYHIGSEVYLKYLLPKGVLLPQNRIQLAQLLWEDAGRPAPAETALYADIDADDQNAQQAAHWAVENGLLKLPDEEKPDDFAPYAAISYAKSARAWKQAQQLKKNASSAN